MLLECAYSGLVQAVTIKKFKRITRGSPFSNSLLQAAQPAGKSRKKVHVVNLSYVVTIPIKASIAAAL